VAHVTEIRHIRSFERWPSVYLETRGLSEGYESITKYIAPEAAVLRLECHKLHINRYFACVNISDRAQTGSRAPEFKFSGFAA
jgi:hypothetical protein